MFQSHVKCVVHFGSRSPPGFNEHPSTELVCYHGNAQLWRYKMLYAQLKGSIESEDAADDKIELPGIDELPALPESSYEGWHAQRSRYV